MPRHRPEPPPLGAPRSGAALPEGPTALSPTARHSALRFLSFLPSYLNRSVLLLLSTHWSPASARLVNGEEMTCADCYCNNTRF
ncbi:hypothetical protein GUJ93_ZPchr0002g23308 [Zizania palustris]|uniref:Uncharacterized protein n=1 Tax=Zizania palustris TaxID=103762 RepID=A0A8J5S967_ZIZPA|nr:hypothetical protein GUJ93_ZPchr0002g23308 [Zizania palustris]